MGSVMRKSEKSRFPKAIASIQSAVSYFKFISIVYLTIIKGDLEKRIDDSHQNKQANTHSKYVLFCSFSEQMFDDLQSDDFT